MSLIKDFVRVRGTSLALIALVLCVISLAQAGISLTLSTGDLRDLIPQRQIVLASSVLLRLRLALLVLLAVLWIFGRRRAMFRVIIVVNGLYTAALLIQTSLLIQTLGGVSAQGATSLISNAVLMSVANILVFSVWYWIVDPPGVEDLPCADQPWDFLFPQRASPIPHYEAWVPHYTDYLFLAFTTSFAFSPTDTLPLTARVKLLMLLQATLSIVTLTGIAGSAINILAGRA